jgi:hypothetical protein
MTIKVLPNGALAVTGISVAARDGSEATVLVPADEIHAAAKRLRADAGVDRSGTSMPTVDGVCACHRCERTPRAVYRMIGRCWNCQTDPVLMLFRAGDTAGVLKCPTCGCNEVHAVRLATEDEIPEAGAADRAVAPVTPDAETDATEKRTPGQWCAHYGVEIHDPDGWRSKGDPPWGQPITLPDFSRRANRSTVRNVASEAWDRVRADAARTRDEED